MRRFSAALTLSLVIVVIPSEARDLLFVEMVWVSPAEAGSG